jgi:hypothetical protein
MVEAGDREGRQFDLKLAAEGLSAKQFKTRGGSRVVITDKKSQKIVTWTPFKDKKEANEKVSITKLKRLSDNFNRPVYQIEYKSKPSIKMRPKKGDEGDIDYKVPSYTKDGQRRRFWGHIFQEWVFTAGNRAISIKSSSHPFRITGKAAIREARIDCYYRAIKRAPFSVTGQKLIQEALIYETSRQPRTIDE